MATKKVAKKKDDAAATTPLKAKKPGKADERKRIAKEKKAASRSVQAILKHVRISPRKMKLVADLVKGMQVEPALQVLRFSEKKGAVFARKLLSSAIANARETSGLDVDKLWITGVWVDKGRTLSRYMPSAHGRATPVRKRSSHVTFVLSEK